ncbi:hypothetical protein G7B40_034260 [Aetokthonos hydrillicola Thurmond2011]|jgi:hypothetical protein|uniref:Uncharacterized protein n=1 Tax=Aetokthonos hydrillicola Thurmond2011 TaxID=2712845 RepID=A0AAP5MBT2_9CYAN|nr:hypothetical protein [Aetokthonos hydrillicola]MBO3462716.1 hypothetical protein [Aetokthonos hydrillicola CCALA 1050]MBW4585249.1 hypothetical protein [Aetokthonos hydrillicola CCALA 1050]MDR9899585.1 hypothetical protein [Aetokthonos hydrillicola Thurmond2011]
MYSSHFFRYFLAKTNSKPDIITENKVSSVPGNHATKPPIELTQLLPVLFIPVLFMIVVAIGALIFPSNVRRKFPQNAKLNTNRFKQVPCRNCQFFNDNHYLNCAVQPSNVLTKEALNCSDYLPNNGTNESESRNDYLG